jgi:peroxiredoxin Q/BCP
MMKVGDSASNFCLADDSGEEHCLDNFKGKWVVLYFYPKDNTSGCTLEARDFTTALTDFEKLNTMIIGVSPDSTKSHQNFITKHDLKIKLLSDPEHKTLEDYGAWQKKKLYGREFMGVVRSTFLISPEGKIEHVWPKVKVNGHVSAVKEKLVELQKE